MLKDFTDGLGKFFSVAGKIVVLAAICLGLGIGIVFPLWKWASAGPKSYTWGMACLLVLGLIYITIGSIRKNGFLKFLLWIFKTVLILVGIFLCIFFVLKSNRILALVVLVVDLILFAIVVSVESASKRKDK